MINEDKMVDDITIERILEETITKPQRSLTTSQPSQNLVTPLSQQAQQAKGDLEILVATGKSNEFTGKQLTFNDVDNMTEKDILKYHRIYQSALAVRVNDTFSKIAVKTYCTLTKWVLPIQDKDKLYEDLRSDYILMNELDKWTGWLSLKMGGLMAVASTTLITIANCELPEFSRNINGGEARGNGDGGNGGEARDNKIETLDTRT